MFFLKSVTSIVEESDRCSAMFRQIYPDSFVPRAPDLDRGLSPSCIEHLRQIPVLTFWRESWEDYLYPLDTTAQLLRPISPSPS